MTHKDTEIVIVGAGIVGIATAYYLSQHYKKNEITIVDPLAPMSFTSAQSGENYRDWWPHPTMRDFINHSIDLMEKIAVESNDVFNMSRRGYVLATRENDIDKLLSQLNLDKDCHQDGNIRFHTQAVANTYQAPVLAEWRSAPEGVDVLANQTLIKQTFPSYSEDIGHIFHIRRAGDISSQQLGQYMLAKAKASGVKLLQAKVVDITNDNPFVVKVKSDCGEHVIHAEKLINAAGPFINEIAQMVGVSLPVHNVLQQKIAFEDRDKVIPREMPFSIDLDTCLLDWDSEERELLSEDEELSWLTKSIPGNIHCRPDGGDNGSWLKLGWAFNQEECNADWQPILNDQYPEIVLRGASRLNPLLKTYYDGFPRAFHHYGGYYPMTKENWPLVSATEKKGMFVVGALSGFGTMAACSAGELCSQLLTDSPLPDYAEDLSLLRYKNHALMKELEGLNSKGIL